eukprot:scaffold3499_cov117-Isochrysis_galbana.AAC.4
MEGMSAGASTRNRNCSVCLNSALCRDDGAVVCRPSLLVTACGELPRSGALHEAMRPAGVDMLCLIVCCFLAFWHRPVKRRGRT